MQSDEYKQTTTSLFLHGRSNVPVLVSVDSIDNFVSATHLDFDDRVLQLRDTRVYRRRQIAVSGVGTGVTA